MRLLGLLGPRTSSAGLPDINQGGSPLAGIGHLLGTAALGLGAGLLGSALLGGLAGLDCNASVLVIPSGALIGVLVALAADGILGTRINPALLAPERGPDTGTQEFSTFEMVGEIVADGSVSGTSGLYTYKELE